MVGDVFIRQQQPLHLQDLLMQQPRTGCMNDGETSTYQQPAPTKVNTLNPISEGLLMSQHGNTSDHPVENHSKQASPRSCLCRIGFAMQL
jgi:hypothetical protein